MLSTHRIDRQTLRLHKEPLLGRWSVWIQHKLAASWSDGQRRPASAPGARRRGLCLLWKLWLQFKTHSPGPHTQTLKPKLRVHRKTREKPTDSLTLSPSHTQLLFLLNSFWWPSIPPARLCAWGNHSDNRGDPNRTRLQPARRLDELPTGSGAGIIELWVEAERFFKLKCHLSQREKEDNLKQKLLLKDSSLNI